MDVSLFHWAFLRVPVQRSLAMTKCSAGTVIGFWVQVITIIAIINNSFSTTWHIDQFLGDLVDLRVNFLRMS